MSASLLDFELPPPEVREQSAKLRQDMMDMVNNPAHYNMGKYETIDIIEDADLGYHLSAALKYILRCKYKGKTDEDLAKAVWYIERYRKLIHGTDTVPEVSREQGDS